MKKAKMQQGRMVVKEKKEISIWENSEQEKLVELCLKLNSALLGNEMLKKMKQITFHYIMGFYQFHKYIY